MPKIEKTCMICGKEIWLNPGQIKQGKGKYCSSECQHRAQDKQAVCQCAWCGEGFTAKRYLVKRGYGKFCSSRCYGMSRRRRQIRICEVCSTKFVRHDCAVNRGQGRFCSFGCKAIWWSSVSSGENCPNWRGGKSFEPYPPAFNESFKGKIRERDNHICAICRMPGKDVHHIDYTKSNTAPHNCVTLCKSCHGITNANRDYWQLILQDLMATMYFAPEYLQLAELETRLDSRRET